MKTIPIDQIKVDMVDVDSSNVSKIGYNDEWIVLAVEMINGNLFYYLDVPKIHYNELLKCNTNIGRYEIKSIGSYLRLNLYGSYRFIQIR